MKKILCFGDSNTYGYIPKSGERYDADTRWTGILQKLSNGRFEIIEAGCNNRTCFVDNPAGEMFTGYKILPKYLQDDLDFVILAIGINDLQLFFDVNYEDIKNGIEKLVKLVQKYLPKTKILVVSPSKITSDVLKGPFSFQFDKTSIEKCQKIGEIYKSSAKQNNCLFLDLDKITKVSSLDGLHYEPESHKKIASAIYEILLEEFKNPSKETF